jgi:hypothetical protein
VGEADTHADAFYRQHGLLDVPDGSLVDWLNRQRELRTAGRLDPARISELDRNRHDLEQASPRLGTRLRLRQGLHTVHGDLAIPATARIDGNTVGRWTRV